MPARLKRACRKPGCPGTTIDRSGYCDKHKPEEACWKRWQDKKGNDRQRGYGTAWRKLRKRILERDRYLCQVCLKNGVIKAGSEVDHIRSKATGGTDNDDNLQAICTRCHREKTATERPRMGRGASET